MSNIYVAGVGMTRFGPQPQATIKSLTAQAVRECLVDAGAQPQQIEAAYFSNTGQGRVEGQHALRGQIALRGEQIHGVPIVNVENACASGSTALWLAAQALRAGAADIVIAVGAEKMVYDDPLRRERVQQGFNGGMDIETGPAALAALERLSPDIAGVSGDGVRTVFMDIYAALARAHMQRFGTTQRQLAQIAAKNHAHSVHNERCHYRKAMTADEVLASRVLTYPLTVAMCSRLSDGAAAAVLCNKAGLRRLRPTMAPVRLRACELVSATPRAWDDFEHHAMRRAAQKAYASAGIGPGDVDVAEVHDAASFGELFVSELMGFCELGAGGAFAESGATALGGRLPINPSGGLECRGHPIGASGLAQVFELVTQLRGAAGARQVEGARIALQENGGGFMEVEEGAVVVSIFERLQRR
ncbi:MAG: lipid-transfer protein [Pseudomonadota bacterium]|nr:thiolase family protein [Rubrivivax sp.]